MASIVPTVSTRPYTDRMARPAPATRATHAEYLALEARGKDKHEFLCGEIFAMAGGTPEHGAVAIAVGSELRVSLRGRPCRVYSSDVRVRVQDTGLTTYPDLSVVCGQLETAPDDPDAITNPVLLVEVLSESTEAYDRGGKAAHYRRIPSLREYLLVDPRERVAEVQRRNEQGVWEIHEARPGQQVALLSLGVRLDVDAMLANPLEAPPATTG
jgi:Uma2 family endonuclease